MSAAFCADWINEVSLALPAGWSPEVPTETTEGDTIYLSTRWTNRRSPVTLSATVANTGHASADISTSRWTVEAENLTPSALAAVIDVITRYGAKPDAPELSADFVGVSLTYHDWQSTNYSTEPVELRRWTSPDGNRMFDYISRTKRDASVFVVHRINPGLPGVEASVTAGNFTPAPVLLSLAMSE